MTPPTQAAIGFSPRWAASPIRFVTTSSATLAPPGAIPRRHVSTNLLGVEGVGRNPGRSARAYFDRLRDSADEWEPVLD